MKVNYKKYLNLLKKMGFSGDIEDGQIERFISSTDNSIYQEIAELILYPKNQKDLTIAINAAKNISGLHITARGAATSNNGAALNNSVIIDFKRYLNKILEINETEKWIKVEAGLTLLELNNFLAKKGYYFTPDNSANIATIGGMIASNSCHKKSSKQGFISEDLIQAECYDYQANKLEFANKNIQHNPKYQILYNLLKENKAIIEKDFPTISSFNNGYNLSKLIANNKLNLNYLLAGSQGSLAIIYSVKLKIIPQEKYQALVIIPYDNLNLAAQDSSNLISYKPFSLEIMDENILNLVRLHPEFLEIKPYIQESKNINIFEIRTNSNKLLELEIQNLRQKYKNSYLCTNLNQINKISEIKNFVLSISKATDKKQYTALGEVIIAPNQVHLYVRDLSKILANLKLKHLIYGHLDIACLYPKIALNLESKSAQKTMDLMIHKLIKLTQKYNGIISCINFRAEYNKLIYSKKTLKLFTSIKELFDPLYKLNPGKIIACKKPNLKANFNKNILSVYKNDFANILACNGNGKCLSLEKNQIICPSAKITKHKIYSPQARANLLRKWLYDLSSGLKPQKNQILALKKTLDACLNCNACRSKCPSSVNITRYKSFFLNWYFQHIGKRKLRDLLFIRSEEMMSYYAKKPVLYNFILQNKLTKILAKFIGLSDLPIFYNSYYKITKNKQNNHKETIYLVTDAFTNFAEKNLLNDTLKILEQHNYHVEILPFFLSGKSYFNEGALNQFNKIAKRNIEYLNHIAAQNKPIISIEPAINLFFREDYIDCFGTKIKFNILLVEEFLAQKLIHYQKKLAAKPENYYLLSYCGESSSLPLNYKNWIILFEHYGLKLNHLTTGCCGMSGNYGYKTEFQHNSTLLYKLSWQEHIDNKTNIVATGFSCRCQIKKLSNKNIKHPIEVLASLITQANH